MEKRFEKKKMNKKGVHQPPAVQEKITTATVLNNHRYPLMLGLVVIIAFLQFSPALHNTFTNWDDDVYVTANPHITTLSNQNLNYIFTHQVANNYHPLTILSLALNYRFAGLTPFSYYLVNILIHLFNIVLVYWLVLLLPGKNKPMALFTAALFAVHPMHVESVAWISERKDVLYTFFFLSGLISFVYFLDKKGNLYYLFTLVLFLLSALSKPTAVIFPVVLLLVYYLRKRKFNILVIAEKIPFFIISAWIGWQTLHSQLEMVSQDMLNFTILQKFLFASYGFFMYIARLFVPAGLSAFYAFPPTGQAQTLPLVFLVTPLVNLAILAGVIYSLRHTRLVAFGILFYFLAVLLTLQFVQVGHSIISDRYTYLAYIGLLPALFWTVDKLLQNKQIYSIKISYLVFFLFFAANAVAGAHRVGVWKNTETLWSDAIEKYPGTALPYNSRGLYYLEHEKYDLSAADLSKAIAADPAYFEAYYNRAGLYVKTGKYEQAISDLNRAIVLNPEYSVSFRIRADAYYFLGKTDSAVNDYTRAIRINPELPDPYCHLGNLHVSTGQLELAVTEFRQALAIRGDNPEYWFDLGTACGKMKNYDEAIKALTKALEYKPDYYEALTNRALAQASTGHGEAALKDMAAAISINPENPSAYFNRALFYLNNGKKDLACSDLQTAIKYGDQAAKEIYRQACQGR